jgi:hypothetical protein
VILGLLVLGCTEKRIMPSTPSSEWEYEFTVEQKLIFNDPSIPSTTQSLEWSIRVVPLSVHPDDSLSLEVHFDEVKQRDELSDWTLSEVSSQSIVVRCFPWGELLSVDGWQELSGENVQWFDFVTGALFPNPPRRSSQQWQNRMLAWPFYLPQLNHSKQIVMANWVQNSEDSWEYQGTYYGKRGVTNFFDGTASGDIVASGPWVDHHSFKWERNLSVPIAAHQIINGVLEKR